MKILTFLTLISVQGHDDIEILSGDGNEVSEDTHRFGFIVSVLHDIAFFRISNFSGRIFRTNFPRRTECIFPTERIFRTYSYRLARQNPELMAPEHKVKFSWLKRWTQST